MSRDVIMWLRWDKVWVPMGIGLGEYLQEVCSRTATDLECQVRFTPYAKV